MSSTDCCRLVLPFRSSYKTVVKIITFSEQFFILLGEITSEELQQRLDGVKEQLASQPDLRNGTNTRGIVDSFPLGAVLIGANANLYLLDLV